MTLEWAFACFAEKRPSICSAYSDNSSLRWGKRKVTAFDILLYAEDQSPPVLTCRLDSATAKTTSVPPTCPFLSSSIWIKCMAERIWWRSTDSPRRIRSHWVEGIPSGRLLATRRSDLTPGKSSLNWRSILQVSTQLPLLDELGFALYQGISSSLALFLTTRCSTSSPSNSSPEIWSKSSLTSSRILFPLVCDSTRGIVPTGGVPLVADRSSSWTTRGELISARYESKAFPFSPSDAPTHLSSSKATHDDAWKRVHSPFLNASISRSTRSKIFFFSS